MSRSLVLYAALAAAVAAAACGGNPSGASGAVMLRGTVVGDATTATASSERAMASAARITVTVQQDPSLTTTVGGNGRFELNGLPEGSFTLVFTSNGVTLGSIEISGAEPGQEIRITVQVTTTTVILINIENADGDDDDGDDGDDEGEDEDDGDDDADRTCAISGGKVGQKIELEGNVSSGDAAGFELRVNGNRVKNGATVRVTTAGASFKCNGQTTATECRGTVKPSAKVHVKGNLDTCDLSSATVTASEVKVQKP